MLILCYNKYELLLKISEKSIERTLGNRKKFGCILAQFQETENFPQRSGSATFSIPFLVWHCAESVRIRNYSCPCFRAFGLNTGRYSVQMRENADQNNFEYEHILRCVKHSEILVKFSKKNNNKQANKQNILEKKHLYKKIQIYKIRKKQNYKFYCAFALSSGGYI